MRTRKAGLPVPALAALLGLALLAGCDAGRQVLTAGVPAGRGEVAWPERQVLFRHEAAQGRLEAYALRGGIAPLGAVQLPAALCPAAMALDPATGRVWLWGERGGVLVDGRGLRVVEHWQGGGARLPLRELAGREGAAGVPARLQMAAVSLTPPEDGACPVAMVAEAQQQGRGAGPADGAR